MIKRLSKLPWSSTYKALKAAFSTGNIILTVVVSGAIGSCIGKWSIPIGFAIFFAVGVATFRIKSRFNHHAE